MLVNVARNGVNLGTFDSDVLKSMAAEGRLLVTDHVYIANEQRWELIERIPGLRAALFPATALSASPQVIAPTVPPPPPSTVVPTMAPGWLTNAPTGQVLEMEMFHGFPKEYWQAYFGDKAHWYMERFDGMISIAELQVLELKWKEEEAEARKNGVGYDRDKQRQQANSDIFRFHWVGLVVGMPWLAYRKNTEVFWMYALVSLMLTIADHIFTSTLAGGLIIVCGVLSVNVFPAFAGVEMLHRQAQKAFLKAEKACTIHKDRVGWIRNAGGASWGYFIGFIAAVAAYETVLFSLFSE